ncbi:MAG: hypothetical protein IJG88_00175 [Eggerthellaceae bacterium]|nr:hypothetical protein [Eggerthellaceae bacterium]
MSADIDAMVANMNAALDAYEKDKDEAALTKAAEEFQAKAQEFQTKYANLDSSKFTEADQNYLMEHMTPFMQLLERVSAMSESGSSASASASSASAQ